MNGQSPRKYTLGDNHEDGFDDLMGLPCHLPLGVSPAGSLSGSSVVANATLFPELIPIVNDSMNAVW